MDSATQTATRFRKVLVGTVGNWKTSDCQFLRATHELLNVGYSSLNANQVHDWHSLQQTNERHRTKMKKRANKLNK